jgi:hypothetical protein
MRYREERRTTSTLYSWKNKFDLMTRFKDRSDIVDTIVAECVKMGRVRDAPDNPTVAELKEYKVRWHDEELDEEVRGKRQELALQTGLDKADAAHLLSGRFAMATPSKVAKKDPANTNAEWHVHFARRVRWPTLLPAGRPQGGRKKPPPLRL